MPEIIFNGPEGRLEGRYQPGRTANAPIGIVLHPHPQYGGTMNNRVVYHLYQSFLKLGFSVLRFNFRGVGRSQGEFDEGTGELSDAASALDWLQGFNANASSCWVAGFSFGSWIGMQLLMRRPEIKGFISVAPPANLYDFAFLAPCPASGLIIQGTADEIVTPDSVDTLATKLRTQKAITVEHVEIKGANHFFEGNLEQITATVDDYMRRRLAPEA
ncbi:MAG: alpha/beta hydrolase [Proteobacteria bacterium]|nr:alpha/beta hydrolase [Pseudomonadota bacterium]